MTTLNYAGFASLLLERSGCSPASTAPGRDRRLSLQVSLGAVLISGAIGLPLGALLAISRFPGRGAVVVLVNALMGLPPVVVGLLVYLMLSNAGPLGVFQLLYTPTAMIIAQTVLVTPIVTALARQTIEDLNAEYGEQLTAFGVGRAGRIATLVWDGRYSCSPLCLRASAGPFPRSAR
jgi:tungstate transport system permease protein